MSTATDIADTHDGPPTTDEPVDDGVVLAWWHNPVNLIALALAIGLLAAAGGFVIGNNRALPDPTATDVGFLQDMRLHHEQAVQIGLIFLDLDDTDPALQTTAREIIVGQNIEIGRMIQLLRSFGESEVNETDLAMGWMSEPVPQDRMPGLATEADLRALRAARGAESDEIFVRLMTAHHEGGIHMADHAAQYAATSEVTLMARQMADGQREEIIEMGQLLTASRT